MYERFICIDDKTLGYGLAARTGRRLNSSREIRLPFGHTDLSNLSTAIGYKLPARVSILDFD